jgi:A-macroglobulin TED domain
MRSSVAVALSLSLCCSFSSLLRFFSHTLSGARVCGRVFLLLLLLLLLLFFKLFEELIDGTISTQLRIYPQPNTTLVASFEHLIRTPHGCFEQVAATMWPMMLALDYYAAKPLVQGFSASQDDPRLVASIEGKLKAGCARLLQMRTASGGFEWYGEEPAHAALTGYGILTLLECERVLGGVKRSVIEEAISSLLQCRDGHGRFVHKAGKYQFSRPDPITADAYVIYALAKAGHKDLEKEITFLLSVVEKGPQDSYVFALTLLALIHSGRSSVIVYLLQLFMCVLCMCACVSVSLCVCASVYLE